jgi:hypothetical protein
LPLAVVLLAACSSSPPAPRAGQEQATPTRQRLTEFGTLAMRAVRDASWRIRDASDDRDHRRNALAWRARAITEYRTILANADDRVVFLDLWASCLQMRQYFTTGEGKEVFGPQQEIPRRIAEQLVTEYERVARKLLKPEEYTAAQKLVNEFAAQHPVRQSYGREGIREVQGSGGISPLALLPSLSLSSFNPFGGIDQTAVAIDRTAAAAERATDVVELLPEHLQWMLEALLLEIDELRTPQALLQQIAQTTAAAEQMPERLASQLERVLTEVDARQANLQRTLGELRAAAAALEQTLLAVSPASESLTGFLQTVAGPDSQPASRPADEPPPPPFDIKDYGATAQAVTAMLQELRTTTQELRAAVDEPRVGAVVVRAADDVTARVLRTGLLLIGALAVALLAVRWLAPRGARPA